MRRIAALVAFSLFLALSACSKDPSTPEYWEKKLDGAKGKKDRVRIIEDLRESKHFTPAIYPVLYKRLETEKSAEVKERIARALGEKKDKGAVDPLSAAADMAATENDVRTMNKEIAIALGNIGDPKGAQTLVKLLGTKDNFTVVAAIEALGEMKAKEGFEALYRIAQDDTIEPFITKKAVIALGEIADPRAVPGVVKLMFKERRGVSFYAESSFALYQMGQPAADALIPILNGTDADMKKWADDSHILQEALVAKAAQVIGDFHDPRGEKALLNLLAYKSDKYDIMLFVRMKAADALGRMRSKEGAKALAAQVGELESNTRQQYVWALVRIGGHDAVPKIIDSASKGSWDARTESLRGIALLGDGGDIAALEKLKADEPKTFDAECKSEEIGGTKDCADVPTGVKKHQERMEKLKSTLEAAKECNSDGACWAKKLNDAVPETRARAAYEIGRSGNAALVSELTKRLKETDLDTRLAIIQGIDWLVSDSKDALKTAQGVLPELEKQVADERGKTEFVKVNEDLRRLPVKLSRG